MIRLSNFDRTMIHGLALMSRPSLIPDDDDTKMLVRIIEKAAARAGDAPELVPLQREARRVAENLGPQRAISHHVAAAMNEFDRRCMAAAWDAARGAI